MEQTGGGGSVTGKRAEVSIAGMWGWLMLRERFKVMKKETQAKWGDRPSEKRELCYEYDAHGVGACEAWGTGHGGLRESPSISRIFLNGKDRRSEGW